MRLQDQGKFIGSKHKRYIEWSDKTDRKNTVSAIRHQISDRGEERVRTFFEKKLLRLSFEHCAVQGHLEERRDFEGDGKMPRTLMYMMRHLKFPIIWVVDVSPMFSGAVTQTFSSLADISAFTVCTDEKVDDVFCFASHLFLNLE